jgi:hypothetical protein
MPRLYTHRVDWRAYGRSSGFHIFPELPRESLEGVESFPWDVFAARPAPILQSLRMALNLEGVDIGSRGTGFLSGIHQCDDVVTSCLVLY